MKEEYRGRGEEGEKDGRGSMMVMKGKKVN
jgi:hypothetical protein